MLADERGVAGAREFLRNLPQHTLLSLCQTVTSNPSECSREDAAQNIILQSPNLESILRRKTMTRDILIQYLHQKGISVSLSTVKQQLISKTVSLWKNDQQLNPQQPVDSAVPNLTELQIMANQFVQWFYPLLKNNGLTVDNFWDNSEVLINLNCSDGEQKSSKCSGVTQVLTALEQLVTVHDVLLSPSTLANPTAELDSHGLVMISCSGTVYQQTKCIGVFQQVFALTSDPFSPGDWRIKRSQLDVRIESQSEKASVPAIHN